MTYLLYLFIFILNLYLRAFVPRILLYILFNNNNAKTMNNTALQRTVQILDNPLPLELKSLILDTLKNDYLTSKRAIEMINEFHVSQYNQETLRNHSMWFETNLSISIRGNHLFFIDNNHKGSILGRSLILNSQPFFNFIQFITENNVRIHNLTLSFVLPNWGEHLKQLISQCDEIHYDYQIVSNGYNYFSDSFEESQEWYDKIKSIGLLSLEQAIHIVNDKRFTNLKDVSIYNNIYRKTASIDWFKLLYHGYDLTLINTALYSNEIDPTIIHSLNSVLDTYPEYQSHVKFNVLMGSFNPMDEFCYSTVSPDSVSILELNSPTDLNQFKNCKEIRIPIDNFEQVQKLSKSIETIVFKPTSKGEAIKDFSNWKIPSNIKSLQFISLDLDIIERIMNSIDWSRSKLIDLRLLVNKITSSVNFNTLPETLECIDITRLRNPSKNKISVHCQSLPKSIIENNLMYKRIQLPIEIIDESNGIKIELNSYSL